MFPKRTYGGVVYNEKQAALYSHLVQIQFNLDLQNPQIVLLLLHCHAPVSINNPPVVFLELVYTKMLQLIRVCMFDGWEDDGGGEPEREIWVQVGGKE